MDVSKISQEYQRDIDNLKNELKLRNEEHSRDLDRVRENSDERANDIESDYAEALKRNNDKNNRRLENEQESLRNRLNDTEDRYERKADEQRREMYNKLGKLEADNQHERENQQRIYKNQFNDYLDSTESEKTNDSDRYERSLKNTREEYLKNQRDLQQYYLKKIDEQKQYAEDQRMNYTQEMRAKVDKNIQDTSEEVRREKIGDEVRRKNYITEKELEIENRDKATITRENKLKEKIERLGNSENSVAGQTIKEQRTRANSEMDAEIQFHNNQRMLRDQQHAADLMRLTHDHDVALQDRDSLYKSSLKDLNQKIKEQERHSDDALNRVQQRNRQNITTMQEDLRRIHESSEAQNHEQYAQNMTHQKQRYETLLKNQQQNTRAAIEKNQDTASLALTEERMRDNRERSEMQNSNRNFQKKLIENYQGKQDTLEKQRQNQLANQETHYRALLSKTQSDKEMSISDNNRDNQLREYLLNQSLRNRTNELTNENEVTKQTLEKHFESKIDRLNRTYSESLMSEKATHDEAIKELNYDSRMKMTKAHMDNEHDSTMRLIDIQSKNREMIENYENKLERMNEEHTAEMARLKAETSKENRDIIKKNKELLDRERSSFEKQLEAKDRMLDEKLKLQSAAFNEQIERLKRTQNASLKTS